MLGIQEENPIKRRGVKSQQFYSLQNEKSTGFEILFGNVAQRHVA